MLESVLNTRNASVRIKLTVKGLVSAGLVALAVFLPQMVHLFAGAAGGVKWLPMYLPVLLGGCLLGTRWGLAVGVASPLVSFLVTTLMGNAMPSAERLPFMMAELAVFAFISGLFSDRIAGNGWMAFPAVLLACVGGRASFLLLAVLFQSVTSFTPAVIWTQIQTGLPALLLQSVMVPLIVMGLRKLLNGGETHD